MIAFILAKKIRVSLVYHADDWHKSEKSRMHILGLVYLSKSFLPNKAYQPHRRAFMDHLESIVIKNPEFAKDCQLERYQRYLKNNVDGGSTTNRTDKKCNKMKISLDTVRLFLDHTKSDVKH